MKNDELVAQICFKLPVCSFHCESHWPWPKAMYHCKPQEHKPRLERWGWKREMAYCMLGRCYFSFLIFFPLPHLSILRIQRRQKSPSPVGTQWWIPSDFPQDWGGEQKQPVTRKAAQVSTSSPPKYTQSPLDFCPLSAACRDHPANCLAWRLNIQPKNFLRALRDLDTHFALILMDNTPKLPAVLGRVSA